MTTLEIKIDRNSNLYINNHWISIDKDNNLEAVFIEFKTEDDDSDKQNKVKILEKLDKKINRKLQAKLIDDEISKYKENDEEVFDDNEDDLQMIENYIYNPETKYINYYQEYEDDSVDDEEPYFDIDGIPDFTSNMLELSNYEFYYFGSDSNDLKYYTRIINDNPIYRISYYESSNELKLNIIGDVIKTFQIEVNKETNKLLFIKTKTNLTQDI
jgi:hypothetical protein